MIIEAKYVFAYVYKLLLNNKLISREDRKDTKIKNE